MFFSFQSLVTALFFSTAVLGAAIESPGNLQKRDEPKGIDVSAYQSDVDWNAVRRNGVIFAYIKATEGTGQYNRTLIVYRADALLRLQESCV